MHLFLFILVIPGLACLYAIILRPVLHQIPALKKFYADADGFWEKVWAMCGNSLTVGWSYIVGGVGGALAIIDPLANAVGDPQLKEQITSALQSNPKVLGYFAMAVSIITIAARLRSIAKA